MRSVGHRNQWARGASAKLFTAGRGLEVAALASPAVNNFG
jgi:hypothetical protein